MRASQSRSLLPRGTVLADMVTALGEEAPGLASTFELGTTQISALARQARVEDLSGPALWRRARRAARPALEPLARRIDVRGRREHLVVSAEADRLLRELTDQVRHRLTVYQRWGFAARSARGLGIAALFHGQSGTGKTLAAEVVASELGVDLFRVDVSAVVSKYIGETEKNLRRIFDGADGSGAVLLFDEADALFGKRTEVRDSHDRYANVEVGYLLQRLEAYRGLAVLTTNMRGAIDDAFLRRIRFIVPFEFPDAAERRQIWSRVFPEDLPTAQLDLDRLAALPVSGGSIRNIALNAAFLAASGGAPVCMRHLSRAARMELDKLGRPAPAALRGWS